MQRNISWQVPSNRKLPFTPLSQHLQYYVNFIHLNLPTCLRLPDPLPKRQAY